jgi:hypothetical protein
MPVITVCQNGTSMGFAPRKNDHLRVKRGLTQGWTKSATRSNRMFLWSVKCPELLGHGYSFTLTVRDCPPTAAAWGRVRSAFQKRMTRLGAIRMHWLTEWQRRGVPHLHGCIWLPPGVDPFQILEHWLQVSGQYGAADRGQDMKPITGALGWLKYLAKHADRGVFNYQRAAESIPEGWQGSTGRMWGHTGEWPLTAPQKLYIDNEGLYAMRRIAQRWRLANARTEPDSAKRATRIRSARRLLQSKDRNLCSVRGSAEWMPRAVSRQVLMHLAASGYEFTWAPDVEEPDSQTLPGFEVLDEAGRQASP